MGIELLVSKNDDKYYYDFYYDGHYAFTLHQDVLWDIVGKEAIASLDKDIALSSVGKIKMEVV